MKKIALLLLTSLAVPSMAFAATDGVLGTTSEGSVSLSVIAQAPETPMAQISGLEDFNFGVLAADDPTPPSLTISNICVFLNVQGTYSLELDGQALGGNEPLSGPTAAVLYFVIFSDPVSGTSMNYSSGLVGFPSPQSQGGFAGSNFGSGLTIDSEEDCTSSGGNAGLSVYVDDGTPEVDGDTFFTDILTFTVSPE